MVQWSSKPCCGGLGPVAVHSFDVSFGGVGPIKDQRISIVFLIAAKRGDVSDS